MQMERLAGTWPAAAPELRKRLGSDRYERWLAPLRVLEEEKDLLRLGAPNKFWLEWIENRYLAEITAALSLQAGRPVEVTLSIDPQLFQTLRRSQREILAGVNGADPENTGLPAPERGAEAPGGIRGAPAGTAPLEPGGGETLRTFVVGPSNMTAYGAACRVVEEPGKVYNPLFVYGACGLGKTHLLRGICDALRARGPRFARYLTGEEFLNQFVASLKAGTIGKFRELYRSPQTLVIDDIHLLGNKVRTQEEFLHTFNSLVDAGHQIVMASDCHPKGIGNLQKSLEGRFISGLVVQVGRPDLATRLAIVTRKAAGARVEFPEAVLRLLAETVRGNVRELIGAFNFLEATSLQEGRPLDLPRAQQLLAEVLIHGRRRLSLSRIAEAVSRHFRMNVEALASPSRCRSLSLARQVAMVLARKYTQHSLAEIGRFFGGRNHTSVKSAEARVQHLLQDNPSLAKDLETITDSFEE